MKEVVLEALVCIAAAAVLMMVHEFSKSLVYMALQRRRKNERKYKHSIFALYRYIDPVGLIFSVTSSVAFSKPFLFRIQDKKTNRILGITGFVSLLICFAASVLALRFHVLGASGLTVSIGRGMAAQLATLFIQYVAILSLGMLFANLFPVSTFDMGLLIAGHSAQAYLGMIKMDAVIKLIFIVAVMSNLLPYGEYRLLQLLL